MNLNTNPHITKLALIAILGLFLIGGNAEAQETSKAFEHAQCVQATTKQIMLDKGAFEFMTKSIKFEEVDGGYDVVFRSISGIKRSSYFVKDVDNDIVVTKDLTSGIGRYIEQAAEKCSI